MLSAVDPCKQDTECHGSVENPKQVGHDEIVLFATWPESNMVTLTSPDGMSSVTSWREMQ